MQTLKKKAESLRRAVCLFQPYDYDLKKQFHSRARSFLRSLANDRFRLEPGAYDIRSNPAGIAVSGEVTLHTDTLYVQISADRLGMGAIMYRKCSGRKDYTGGRNRFSDVLSFEHSADRWMLELKD